MTARGIRNCNPGNIRHGGQWQGLADTQTDSEFCTFQSMAWGIRALFKVLQTYHRHHGIKTVHGVVRRYAPPLENDTGAYVDHVAQAVGVPSHKVIDLGDSVILLKIAKAIARHENGADAEIITPAEWREGASLAGLNV